MKKYNLVSTASFKKDLKRITKRGYNITLLNDTVEMLLSGTTLPEKYKDHQLTGNFKNFRECHIAPDWLLIYRIEESVLVLTLIHTGTHSDLF